MINLTDSREISSQSMRTQIRSKQ